MTDLPRGSSSLLKRHFIIWIPSKVLCASGWDSKGRYKILLSDEKRHSGSCFKNSLLWLKTMRWLLC